MDLQFLNLSFNNFEGELPKLGIFKNVSAIDIRGNPKLCGGVPELHLPKCILQSTTYKYHRIVIILCSICSVFICLSIVICFLTFHYWGRSQKTLQVNDVAIISQYKQVSYDEIFTATNGFSSENLIGMGSFGAVYKAVMSFENITTVAVKVLNLEQHGASRSFLSECEALRNIKHRNLIKVLSSCSSIDNCGNDFKALIFEFMANGSLETWLHPTHISQPFRSLSIIQRMNIAYDVAIALEYLHHHGSIPIIHCDLKPSNILLDEDMIAHVGDFGLAKFLVPPDNVFSQPIASSGGIKGSIGYIPPEYGMGGKASEQGDMYSYGILLLEMFTGINPTDERFKDGLSLHNFVEMSFPDKIMDIVDTKRASINDEESNEDMLESVYDCLVLVLRCGILCSKESPQERAGIKEVLKDLNSARKMLLRRDI
ncbi:hypothetical protein LUZ60_005461 [Juncus effusus]|nr:hypothetical protein LUZ60_005461 [Juncus effusus]